MKINKEKFKTKEIDLFAFDVDGTLSISRSRIDSEMSVLLKEILKTKKVAIITGGGFADIKKQVLTKIGLNNKLNKNLILLPINGSNMWIFKGKWIEIFCNKLTNKEKIKIIKAIEETEKYITVKNKEIIYGKKIQDRQSGITYSALGDKAKINLKNSWDPDFKKRILLQKILLKKLPNFEVKIGGTTSIDITKKGIDKSFAIKKVMNYLKINKENILFFGDAIYKNGNDYPVYLSGIKTIKVANPADTKKRIKKLLNLEKLDF